MECSIIHPVLSLLMKHLFIGQHQKAPNFSAFHWLPHGSLVSAVHSHKGSTFTESSLITKSDRSGPNYQIEPGCVGRA